MNKILEDIARQIAQMRDQVAEFQNHERCCLEDYSDVGLKVVGLNGILHEEVKQMLGELILAAQNRIGPCKAPGCKVDALSRRSGEANRA